MGDDIQDRGYDELMLEAKTTATAPRRSGASRRHLIDSARRSGARVVSVVAPAGYGKSTLLAEWADSDDRPVAWASIDRLDDDPAALLTLLAAAVARVFPSATRLVGEMRGLGPASLGRSAPLLGAALAAASQSFVLMIDDLQEADSPACRDVLDVVVAGVPSGSQVVFASRHEPANLARRRAAGDLFEIGVQDLRLDTSGARAIFGDVGVEITDEELAQVVRRCEGWPTALFLAATIISRGDTSGWSITGDDRFVADYLYEECLTAHPEAMRSFLRRTAILDQLSGPVCDHLLDDTGSSERLREIESLGLFLIPLDRRRGVFRYHALFREFLLGELERRDGPMVESLHRRAADWNERHGSPGQAIEHLLAIGDKDRSVHLVTQLALPTYQEGRVAVVGRWMSELGDEAIIGYPPLAVLAAWTALLTGDSSGAERWASIVETCAYDGEAADDQPTFESGRAMLRAAMCAEGVERALSDAEFGAASEPTWSPWRDQALHLVGAVRLLVGDHDGARSAFIEASAQAERMGNADSIVLSEAELAAMDMDDNAWSDAERHVDAALHAIDAHRMEGYLTTGLALATGARAAVHRGQADDARRLLARGMRARAQTTHTMPYLAIKVRLQLARAFIPLGERTSAMHLIREMEEILGRRADLGLLGGQVAEFRRRVGTAQRLEGAAPLTPAELRLLPYLQTHLTVREIADRLFISRNTASSEVGSIYRKLGATTRSEAVARAIAIGFLGD